MSQRTIMKKTALAGLLVTLFLPLIFLYTTREMNHKINSFEKVLSPPEKITQPSGEHLPLLVATALQHKNGSPAERTIRVANSNRRDFKLHLSNAGAQRGWLVQTQDYNMVDITMPKRDISVLDEMAQDPIAWVSQKHRPSQYSGTTTPDVVTVPLSIDNTSKAAHFFLYLAAVLNFIALMGAFVIGLSLIIYAITQPARASHSPR